MTYFYYAALPAAGSTGSAQLFQFDPAPDLTSLPAGAFAITEEQYDDWSPNLLTRAWQNGTLVAIPGPVVTYDVPAVTVVNRLIAAGKLRAAYAALQIDAPAAQLTDAALALRERWKVASTINSADPDAIALLEAVGADPAVILAAP